MVPQLTVIGITDIPEVNEGDDLAGFIFRAALAQGTPIYLNDVLVITQKIVSKAEGAVVDLREIEPSPLAKQFAEQYDKDPRHIEVVLRQTRRIVRMDRGILIVESKHGFISANAGVDASNIPGEHRVSLLPEDPDSSARHLRKGLMDLAGCHLSVIISDTFGRPWRNGNTDIAIGVAGINPLRDYRGTIDPHGYSLKVSLAAIADQIASAAELVAGKTSQIPVSIVRGYTHSPDEDATVKPLLRESSLDLFR